jgi:hypothetical protein
MKTQYKIDETKYQEPEKSELSEQIIACSACYHREHRVKQYDVNLAKKIIALRESLGHTKPIVGDIVICKAQSGKVYENGHLESLPNENSYSNICTGPYVPFVLYHDGDKDIYCDTSGGYWLTEKDTKALKPAGKRMKLFKAWGHNGACGNGAFFFKMLVSVWEYESEHIY